ncbi:MAG TPA: HAD family hydrolase, partial [Candidatus Saccharimonadales bacterium]
KTVPTAVKFIYCDVNGVMVRFYHHAFVSLSEETGVPLDKVESTFWHYNDACNRGEITLEGFNKSMAHHLGVKRVDWRRHYMGSVQPIKETHEFLARAETKYKIGLLTNIMPGFLAEMFGLGVLPQLNFSAIVDSTKVGAVKPEDKIYLKAEAMAGCKGQEIFFIDDSRANLTEAERFNWRVFWFDDFDPAESVRRIEQTLER